MSDTTTRCTRWSVNYKGAELETVIEIQDDDGEYVNIYRSDRSVEDFMIFATEWPAIRAAIDNAFAEIKRNEEAEKVGES